MPRTFAVFATLYIAGVLADDILTYLYVVELRMFGEANPMNIFVNSGLPLWTWILVDMFVLFITLAMHRLYIAYMDRKNLGRIGRIVAYTSLTSLTAIRLLPAIHNALLLFFGIETPLPRILYGMP